MRPAPLTFPTDCKSHPPLPSLPPPTPRRRAGPELVKHLTTRGLATEGKIVELRKRLREFEAAKLAGPAAASAPAKVAPAQVPPAATAAPAVAPAVAAAPAAAVAAAAVATATVPAAVAPAAPAGAPASAAAAAAAAATDGDGEEPGAVRDQFYGLKRKRRRDGRGR